MKSTPRLSSIVMILFWFWRVCVNISSILLMTVDSVESRASCDDKYIMIQCLSVTFLFIPALLPSPVQSCYDWMKHSIWQKNKLQDTKQIQKNQFTNLNLILQTNNIETQINKEISLRLFHHHCGCNLFRPHGVPRWSRSSLPGEGGCTKLYPGLMIQSRPCRP